MHPKFREMGNELDSMPALAELRIAGLIDLVRDQLDDLIDSVGVEEVIRQVHTLYDVYVAPVNVPFVPDILEPSLIDAPIKQVLAGLIRRLHERIHDED